MVATAVLLLEKLTLPPVPEGRPTLYWAVCPTCSLPSAGDSEDIFEGAFLTVTLHFLLRPLTVFAVMVALPSFTPYSSPVAGSTLTTLALLVDQVTAVAHSLSPSGGVTSAFRPA